MREPARRDPRERGCGDAPRGQELAHRDGHNADNAPKATEKATEKKLAKENLQVYRTRFGNDVPLPLDADLRRDRPLGNFPVWQAWGRGCGRAQDPGGLAMD